MDGPQSLSDYQKLISEIIKKQMALLGSDIALSRARNVTGLTISHDGTVTAIIGEPREMLQKVVDEYFVFSGMIVRRAMESLLANYPSMASSVEQSAITSQSETQKQPTQTPGGS